MRIICDHCNRDINGTVKRVAGNFNLHPQCAAQLGNAQQESTALLCLRQESLISTSPVWKLPCRPSCLIE